MDGNALSKFCKTQRVKTQASSTAAQVSDRVKQHRAYVDDSLLSAAVGPTNVATWPLSDDRVTISLPTRGVPAPALAKAAASILNGRHRNVRLVLGSDAEGHPPWEDLPEELRNDPRLVCFRSPVQLGPFFLHDVVLRCAEGPFFGPQDPGDESHPERLEIQTRGLLATRADAIFSAVSFAPPDAPSRTVQPALNPDSNAQHRAEHFGLWASDSLRAAGGYHGGIREGLDTIFPSVLMTIGRVVATDRSLYVRRQPFCRRHPEPPLQELYEQTWAAAQTSATEGLRFFSTAMGRGARETRPLRDELVAHLREAFASRGFLRPPACSALVDAVFRTTPVDQAETPRRLAEALYRHCEKTNPRRLLATGTGAATLMLALYAARYGSDLTVIEHDAARLEKTRQALAAAGLEQACQLIHRRLRERDGCTWYEYDPEAELGRKRLDFAFVGAPPLHLGVGRLGSLLRLRKHVRPGAQVWVADGKDMQVRQAVIAWRKSGLSFTQRMVDHLDGRGVWQLKIRETR